MLEITPYNPHWPQEYEEIAAALRRALGEMALRIDPIGSTSIPGLAAKDIIDVQLAVARFDECLVQALAGLGYPLLFRDYLRCHPAAAAGYEALKRVLVQYHAEDRVVYTLIKDPVCDVILSAAEEWARQTGWVER